MKRLLILISFATELEHISIFILARSFSNAQCHKFHIPYSRFLFSYLHHSFFYPRTFAGHNLTWLYWKIHGILWGLPSASFSDRDESKRIFLLLWRARKLTKHSRTHNQGCEKPHHSLYVMRRLYQGSKEDRRITLISRNLCFRKTPRENCNYESKSPPRIKPPYPRESLLVNYVS